MLLSLVAPGVLSVLLIVALGIIPGIKAIVLSAVALLVSTLLLKVYLTIKLPPISKGSVAFFHPFANGGGGGERVLWCAVAALQKGSPGTQIVVYSGDGLSVAELLQNAVSKFNIAVTDSLRIIPLRQRQLLLPEAYPRFTLLGQAQGAVRLAYEALSKHTPEVFVETTGWAFAYPLVWLAGCRVASYTHYPTVSTNMLQRVIARTAAFNNDAQVAGSLAKSLLKTVYYYIVAALYGAAGGFSQVAMVNSSWTAGHIAQLWWRWQPPTIVYPPCDTKSLQDLPLDRKLKRLYLVSVAQFRPEKDHALQLRAYAYARQAAVGRSSPSELKLIGSCRDERDQQRINGLRALCQQLGIQDHVEFIVNADFLEVKQLLGGAVGGLHTMLDEHFGISIVEYMAAGVIPIANDSGGPRADIIQDEPMQGRLQPVGYLCSTLQEYADAITDVLCMQQTERLKVAAAARK
eukprot:jgi/Astpho2/7701/Aster-02580